MAIIDTLQTNINEINSAFQAIKGKIIEKGVEVGDELRPREYAPKVAEVYEKGKQSTYDVFWDSYQDNGNRTDYSNVFSGAGWNAETFKPKYDIVPTNGYMIFRASNIAVDLVAHLENLGVNLDFSNCSTTQYMFNQTSFTRLGVLDFSGSGRPYALDNTFNNSKNLITIDKIILRTGSKGEFDNAFPGCTALKNVTFVGKITKTGLNMSTCPNLSKDSIENIIDCLDEDASGQSITLSEAAVDKAFESDEGNNDGTSTVNWLIMTNKRPNWTISLV